MTPEEIASLPYRRNVGAMLLNAQGEVFVAQRNDRDAEAWQMPQGGIEDGEEPRDAVLRELCEETGVTADLVEIIAEADTWLTYDLPNRLVTKIWQGRYRGQTQKWFLMRFLGTDAQIDIATEHPEFTEWRWQSVDQLVANIVPFKRDVYRQVVATFAARL